MLYRDLSNGGFHVPDVETRPSRSAPSSSNHAQPDWRRGLPTLNGRAARLRDLRPADAEPLFAMLNTEEVSRFISPPPSSAEGFARFIQWTARQRTAGAHACFALTMQGCETALGIIQVGAREERFRIAEWGFAVGSPFWGTGLFHEGAELMLQFIFETLGTQRLEARAAVRNGRGQGALRKLGGVAEGILRGSLRRDGVDLDQVLYAILGAEWRAHRSAPAAGLSAFIH